MKRVKLAMLRRDDENPCPFGLKIPNTCKVVGNKIDSMRPLDDATDNRERENIAFINNRMLAWDVDGDNQSRCRYAAKVFEAHNASECNYNDVAPGVAPVTEVSSPSFSRNFDQPDMVGLMSYPQQYYSEFGSMQNGYYGLYSLQGEVNEYDMLKLAEEKIEKGE